MATTVTGGFPDDLEKWLALAAAAASVGLLPKGWQKALGATSALIWFLKEAVYARCRATQVEPIRINRRIDGAGPFGILPEPVRQRR